MPRYQNLSLLIILTFVGYVAGCRPAGENSQPNAELVSGYRSQLVVAEEPGGAIGILELRAKMEGIEDSHEGHEHGESADHEHHDSASDTDEDHAGHNHQAAGHSSSEDADHDHHDADHDHHDIDSVGNDQSDHDHGDADHDHGHGDADHHQADDADPEHAEHDHGSEQVAGSKPAIEMLPAVTVVGKIAKQSGDGGVETTDFPWEKGVAAFVIVDPAAEGEEAEHQHKDGEECPFCAKKKIEAQAIVQFHQDGKPISVDARDLFGLSIDDIVIVQGDARLTGGVLMIEGRQLHVRK